MGGKAILEAADEGEPVDDERLGAGERVGKGKLNDWFLDDHYVVEVVLLLAVDLYLLEERVLYQRDEVVQPVKLLLEVRRLVPHLSTIINNTNTNSKIFNSNVQASLINSDISYESADAMNLSFCLEFER